MSQMIWKISNLSTLSYIKTKGWNIYRDYFIKWPRGDKKFIFSCWKYLFWNLLCNHLSLVLLHCPWALRLLFPCVAHWWHFQSTYRSPSRRVWDAGSWHEDNDICQRSRWPFLNACGQCWRVVCANAFWWWGVCSHLFVFFLSSLFLPARSFANDEIVFHCIHPQEFEYAMRFAWKVVIGYSMVSCQIVSLSSILMFEIKEM